MSCKVRANEISHILWGYVKRRSLCPSSAMHDHELKDRICQAVDFSNTDILKNS